MYDDTFRIPVSDTQATNSSVIQLRYRFLCCREANATHMVRRDKIWMYTRRASGQKHGGNRVKKHKPELKLRHALHKMGYRYRLHVKLHAGKPDLVLKKYGAVVFVNGCFWHKHTCESSDGQNPCGFLETKTHSEQRA